MPKIDILVQDETGEVVNTEATGVFLPLDADDSIFDLLVDKYALDVNNCYLIKGKVEPVYKNGEYAVDENGNALVNDYIQTLLNAGLQVLVHKDAGTTDFSFLNDKSQYNIKFITNGYESLVTYNSSGEEETVVSTTDVPASAGGLVTYTGTPVIDEEFTITITPSEGEAQTQNLTLETNQTAEIVESGTYINTGDTLYTITTTETKTVAKVTLSDRLTKFNDIATTRADCLVIGRIEPDSATKYINNNDLATIKKDLADILFVGENNQNSGNPDKTGCVYNRTGLFVTRHSDIRDITTDDEIITTLKIIDTLPEAHWLKGYGALLENNNQWETVAGVNRGVTSGFTANSAVSKYFLDNTVQDTVGYSFNGVVDLRPTGLVLWGDRTLTYNKDSEIYKNFKGDYYLATKASSYLSTMCMVCDLCKRIYNASIQNTFETNNNITWTNYKTSISQLLDEMVAAGKIRAYKLAKLESNRASIRCKIYIVPLAPVENFDINVVLTDSEVTVNPNV